MWPLMRNADMHDFPLQDGQSSSLLSMGKLDPAFAQRVVDDSPLATLATYSISDGPHQVSISQGSSPGHQAGRCATWYVADLQVRSMCKLHAVSKTCLFIIMSNQIDTIANAAKQALLSDLHDKMAKLPLKT